jgi:hypothetical protein
MGLPEAASTRSCSFSHPFVTMAEAYALKIMHKTFTLQGSIMVQNSLAKLLVPGPRHTEVRRRHGHLWPGRPITRSTHAHQQREPQSLPKHICHWLNICGYDTCLACEVQLPSHLV